MNQGPIALLLQSMLGYGRWGYRAARDWCAANSARLLFVSLAAVLLIRLISLGWIPLLDRTESRSALVSRLMYEDGRVFNLQTVIAGEEVPYLSKPPFHYWLVELAYHAGSPHSEFAARFPAVLAAVLTVLCTCVLGSLLWSRPVGLIAGLLLSASGLFYLAAGLCLVDMTLTAATTAAITAAVVGLRTEVNKHTRWWALSAGLALGVGFITKGPVALALPMLAFVLWLFWQQNWKMLAAFPWRWTAGGFLALSIPVYAALEWHNPGFLKYFLINENVLRFLVRDYGDRSGSGHVQVYGTSWLFLLASFMPWSPYLIWQIWRYRTRAGSGEQSGWARLMLCWGLAPAIFFTFARQNLATYLLPGFPGLCLYMSSVLNLHGTSRELQRDVFWSRLLPLIGVLTFLAALPFSLWLGPSVHSVLLWLLIIPVFLLTLRASMWNPQWLPRIAGLCVSTALLYGGMSGAFMSYLDRQHSTRELFSELHNATAEHTIRIFFPYGIPYSASFYAQGPLGYGFPKVPDTDGGRKWYVVRTKDVEAFEKLNVTQGMKEVLQYGKWAVFERLPAQP